MDAFTSRIVTVVLFVITYLGLLIFSKHKSYIALGAAILFLALSILPIGKLLTTINWNLLLMLMGIMGIVSLVSESNMPALLGDTLIAKTSNLKWVMVILAVLSGIISAFVDNVATVLIIAPIALMVAKKTETSPVVPIIIIAIMSNLQGAATLVGDTTSILLGAEAGMNFFDFFVFQGKMGLFFVVQISMILAIFFLLFVFRKYKQKVKIDEISKCTTIFPTILLALSVVLLILASFVPDSFRFDMLNGVICVSLFIVGAVHHIFRKRNQETDVETAVNTTATGNMPSTENKKNPTEIPNTEPEKKKSFQIKSVRVKRLFEAVKGIDFQTLLLIASLFVIVGGVKNVGIIDLIAKFFLSISDNVFVIYTIIVLASVILSAFIDNIPYVAAMLPVAAGISTSLGIEPYLLYFGLICGATLGGNLTPIGASANIAGIGLLRKEGYKVGLLDFIKISIPFTLITVTSGYLLIWFTWA